MARMPLIRTFIAIVCIISMVSPAYAVGSASFENASYSARSLGRGNAYVASGDDPSVVSFNAASLTEVRGTQLSAGAFLINPLIEHNGANGGQSENATVNVFFTPNAYLSTDFHTDNRVNFGFAFTAPYGLATEYSTTGFTPYIGYYTKLEVLGFSPVMALQLTPWLSIGGGGTYYSSSLEQSAKLSRAVVASPQDANMRLDTHGEGWGWNVGLLLKPHEKHSIGVNFRSPARLEYKGGLSVDGLTGGYAAVFGGDTFFSSVNTDITLPPALTAGYAFRPTDKWLIESDVSWVGWSTYDRAEFALAKSNAVLAGLTPQSKDYDDTINVHLGIEYKLTDYLRLRTGYHYYETPVRDANFTPVNPDNDKHSVSVGIGYEHKNFAVDLAYEAMIVATREVNNSVGNSSGANVDGTYKSFLNIAAMNVTYKFDQGE